MKRYLHIMDLAFSFSTDCEDPLTEDQVPQIIEAVKERLDLISRCADVEAFGLNETVDHQQERNLRSFRPQRNR